MRKHFGLVLVLAAAGYFIWRYLVKPTDVKANAIGPATSAVVNGKRIFVTPPGQQAVQAPDGTYWNVSMNSIRDAVASFFGNGAGPSTVAASGGTALAPQVNDGPGPSGALLNPGPVTIAAGIIPTSKPPAILSAPGNSDPSPATISAPLPVAVGETVAYPGLPDNHPLNESSRPGLFLTPVLEGGPISITEDYVPALKTIDRGSGDVDNVVTTIPAHAGSLRWRLIENEML